jgi:UDP-N-acetylglucosamine 4,6-dehydratase
MGAGGAMRQGGVLLITGGAGSFGNAVLRAFLNSEIGEIRIFSRDEKKQDDQRKFYRSAKLKYYVGEPCKLAVCVAP